MVVQDRPLQYVVVQFVVEGTPGPAEARKLVTDTLASDNWSTAAFDVLYAGPAPGHVQEANQGGSA